MGQQVGLINTYSTLNIGDSAIYSALASLVAPAITITTVQDLHPELTPGVTIVPTLPDCDAYISVGGDIFNNAREAFVTKTFLKNLWQLRRSPRSTLLFGQSIPRSCHGFSFWLLTLFLRQLAAVCVRDAQSFNRLRRAGVKAILSYDSAFVLTTSTGAEIAARQVFSQLDVNPDHVALISLRAFDAMYRHDNTAFQTLLIRLCQILLDRGHLPVLLLQSQSYGADNDLTMAASITAALPQVKIFNPFTSTQSISNWELVMGALALARLAIGVRYHTTVLRLATGRMPFNLYYSNKGRDLTERLNIPGCDLGQFDPAQQIEWIEQTAEQSFDHAALRHQVQSDFAACFQRVR